MKKVLLCLIVVAIAVLPTLADTVEIRIRGNVIWNFARSAPLNEVQVGEDVEYYMEVDTEGWAESPNFPTRGYEVDQATFAVTFTGGVQIGAADPYQPWYVPPYFVLRNNDPAADGFFMSSNNLDWPWPGIMTSANGFCGAFEAHGDIGYTGDTLDSLDIRDAYGRYDFTGLTRYYTNLVDCGFEVIGIDFYDMTIMPAPVEVAVDVKPGGCPSPVNIRARGVAPVAIMGSADLDVMTIDPASVRLDGAAPVMSSYDDVGSPFYPYVGKTDCYADCNDEYDMADGNMDLELKFDNQDLGSMWGNLADGTCYTATLTGNFKPEYGGGPIIGEDVVIVMTPGSRGRTEINVRDRMDRGMTNSMSPTGEDDEVRSFGRKR